MIQLDGLNSGCIEWNGILSSRLFKQVLLADKQELGLRVHEALNQPWARDAVHFNVFTGNPFHSHLTVGTRVNQNGGTMAQKAAMTRDAAQNDFRVLSPTHCQCV